MGAHGERPLTVPSGSGGSAMASIKEILTCIGVDTSQNTSVLVDLFGFARGQVPTDPEPGVAAEVSVLQQVRGARGQPSLPSH